jgi:hypothetical protein
LAQLTPPKHVRAPVQRRPGRYRLLLEFAVITFAVVLAVMVLVTEIDSASDDTGAALDGAATPTVPTTAATAPTAPTAPMATTATMRSPPGERLRDPGFERGLGGWHALSGKLQSITVAHAGNWGAKLTGADGAAMTSGPIARVKAGENYHGTIWIRSDQPGAEIEIRVLERVNGRPFATDVIGDVLDTGWEQMEVIHTGHRNGAVLEMQIVAVRLGGGALFLDDAGMRAKRASPMSGMSP